MATRLFAGVNPFSHLTRSSIAAAKPKAADDDETEEEKRERERKEREDAKAKGAKADDDDDTMDDADDERKRRENESDDDYDQRMKDLDDKEEGKRAKKAKGTKADSDDDDDDDEKDKKDPKASAARDRERARCETIFLSPAASGMSDMAAYFAFRTKMSRTAAVCALEAVAARIPVPVAAAPVKQAEPSLRDRMAAEPAHDVGADAPQGGKKLSVAEQIIAAGKRSGMIPA